MQAKNETMTLFEIPMEDNDAGVATIGEYFRKMLQELWREGEGFSGKRPFGNSGWQYEVYEALVRADVVRGEFDEDGYLEDFDNEAADKLVAKALETFGM